MVRINVYTVWYYAGGMSVMAVWGDGYFQRLKGAIGANIAVKHQKRRKLGRRGKYRHHTEGRAFYFEFLTCSSRYYRLREIGHSERGNKETDTPTPKLKSILTHYRCIPPVVLAECIFRCRAYCSAALTGRFHIHA